MFNTRVLVAILGFGLVGFLVVAGTLAHDINKTSVALAILSLLGLILGKNDKDKTGGDD